MYDIIYFNTIHNNNFVNLHVYNLIDTNDFGIVIGKIEFFFLFFIFI